MRAYYKLKASVETALKTLRSQYIDKIKEAYTTTYEQLKNLASYEGVDTSIIETVDHAITSKTTAASLDSLLANVNTDAYYQINVGKITAAKAAKVAASKPAAGAGSTSGSGKQPYSTVSGYGPQTGNSSSSTLQQPKSATISLHTRTTRILRNSDDVDAYLEDLKAQIMRHIDNNEEVTIL